MSSEEKEMLDDKYMFVLCEYVYDYYEWEEALAVSYSKGALEDFVALDSSSVSYCLAATKEEHERLGDKETAHYFIRKILRV